MEQRFPMENGHCTCRHQGDRVQVTLEVHPKREGLYRGFLLGPAGRVDLGLLVPEGGCLRLTRTLEVGSLRRRGCWPIRGSRVECTHAFGRTQVPRGWQEVRDLDLLFPQDVTLARAAGECAGGKLQRVPEGGFTLSFPWDPGRPFPLVPVFCFAEVRSFPGGLRVVYNFREDGHPILPEE